MTQQDDNERISRKPGDIALLRSIVTHLDACLRITGDVNALSTAGPGDVQAMQENLLRAAYAAANALSGLGDQSAIAKFSVGLPEQAQRRT